MRGWQGIVTALALRILTRPDRSQDVFDANGRLVQHSLADGIRLDLSYDASSGLSSISDPPQPFLRGTIASLPALLIIADYPPLCNGRHC